MKRKLTILFSASLALGFILLASACLPSSTATPVSPCSTVEPIDFTPDPGGGISWVDGSIFLYIPPGEFRMGQDETEPSDHSPARQVLLDAFWIQQTEVTNRMYARCVDLGICSPPYPEDWVPYWYANPAHADAPVVGVDWFQAETYCEWIGGRLASEAQWEKAARGIEGDPYPWGQDDPTCDLLNYDDCLEPSVPIDVGSYLLGVSFFELHDTAGNVFEWVHDWYDEDYYAASPLENPTGPADGELRVYRGSDHASEADELPLYLRLALDPLDHDAALGFRCVLTGEAVGNPPPPACELPAYSLPQVGSEPPAVPDLPQVTALGYCLRDENNDSHGYVNLVFDQPVAITDFNITASVPIPEIVQDNNNPATIILVDMPVEEVFELTLCPVVALPPVTPQEPLCPVGYFLDTITGNCRYMNAAPDDSCHEGQVWLEGYGYITPVTDPFEQILLQVGCTLNPGFEIVVLSESPRSLVCLPVDGISGCEGDPDCSTSTQCLPGMDYQPDDNCCLQPESFEPFCLSGYDYDSAQMLCLPQDPVYQCTSFYIYIPACDAPTLPSCQNPAQYTDKTSCEAGNCRWVAPLSGGPQYCAYP